MARRMEENRYDDLTQARLNAPMTKIVVWDGEVYVFDVGEESNAKLDEHMSDMLEMATKIEGDDLNVLVAEGIGGKPWADKAGVKIGDLDLEQVFSQPEKPNVPPPTAGSIPDDAVRDIRNNKDVPAKAMAEKYEIHIQSVYSIRAGKTYKHVR